MLRERNGFSLIPVLLIVAGAIIIDALGYATALKYAGMTTPSPSVRAVQNIAPPVPTTAVSNNSAQEPGWVCTGEAKRGCARPDFNLVAPNGGEILCLGNNFTIQWKVPPDVESVTLTLRQGSSTSIPIGTFPASYNETGEKNGEGSLPWDINGVPEGDAYEMWINASYKGSSVNDVSDGLFAIRKCQG